MIHQFIVNARYMLYNVRIDSQEAYGYDLHVCRMKCGAWSDGTSKVILGGGEIQDAGVMQYGVSSKRSR